MATKEELQEVQNLLLEKFGSREASLGFQIIMLSQSQQPCDITFWNKEPVLDVTIDQQISIAMMYGAGAKKIQDLLSSFRISNGDHVAFGEIWTIHPMPREGFSDEELAAVDLVEADEVAEPGGATLRQMIRDTYHAKNREEEDRYLRRYLAS